MNIPPDLLAAARTAIALALADATDTDHIRALRTLEPDPETLVTGLAAVLIALASEFPEIRALLEGLRDVTAVIS